MWQADPDGTFGSGRPGARVPATVVSRLRPLPHAPDGGYRFVTVKPGPLPAEPGVGEAPHLDVSVFARGLLHRLVTRIYFPDEAAANAADPVLASIAERDRRGTLLAVREPDRAGGSVLRFDIHLQGDQETVFFDV